MNNFLDKSILHVSEELNEDKASRTIKKVRKQAKKNKGDYSLTKDQVAFLKLLSKKYGKDARSELEEFRIQTLAPLHYVQKKTRESGAITTKDLMGLTKKEWERAVESGRNKIKRRGAVSGKISGDIKAIEHNRRTIQKLERIKRMISGRGEVNKNLVRSEIDKFIKNYNFIGDGKISDLKQVQMYANDIERSWKNLESEINKGDDISLDSISKEARNILDKQYNYRRTSSKKEEKEYDETLSKSVADYYFRQNIVNKILSSGDNVFKAFYLSFLTKLANDSRRRIREYSESLRKRGTGLEFNSIERKVWGVNKNASNKSGDISDYYLKIEEEDFDERSDSRTIKQPEEMKQSKKKVENERYNFIQRFKKRHNISDEDFEKMQDIRLLSFVDKDRILRYAKSKLKNKMRESGIKLAVDKILYRAVDEKEAEKMIDKLSNSIISSEDLYEKAYRLFSGDLDKPSIRSIVDAVIRKSRTEREAERKINSAYEKIKEGSSTVDEFKRSVLGDE